MKPGNPGVGRANTREAKQASLLLQAANNSAFSACNIMVSYLISFLKDFHYFFSLKTICLKGSQKSHIALEHNYYKYLLCN
jgi:hypothetical protein